MRQRSIFQNAVMRRARSIHPRGGRPKASGFRSVLQGPENRVSGRGPAQRAVSKIIPT
jgi:hypothetical protein